uniref:Uncharacterized protein n=1 Tax=Panagrolaimus sp. ES5 TaxID=591445 RepID=A0AC34FCU0_9BILA
MVQTFKRAINKGKMDRPDASPTQLAKEFLLAFRTTPNISTGETPAFLFYGRQMRTIFDALKPALQPTISKRQNQMNAEEKETATIKEKQMQIFMTGQPIWYKLTKEKKENWKKGCIDKLDSTNIYLVKKEDGNSIRLSVNQLRDRKITRADYFSSTENITENLGTVQITVLGIIAKRNNMSSSTSSSTSYLKAKQAPTQLPVYAEIRVHPSIVENFGSAGVNASIEWLMVAARNSKVPVEIIRPGSNIGVKPAMNLVWCDDPIHLTSAMVQIKSLDFTKPHKRGRTFILAKLLGQAVTNFFTNETTTDSIHPSIRATEELFAIKKNETSFTQKQCKAFKDLQNFWTPNIKKLTTFDLGQIEQERPHQILDRFFLSQQNSNQLTTYTTGKTEYWNSETKNSTTYRKNDYIQPQTNIPTLSSAPFVDGSFLDLIQIPYKQRSFYSFNPKPEEPAKQKSTTRMIDQHLLSPSTSPEPKFLEEEMLKVLDQQLLMDHKNIQRRPNKSPPPPPP